MLWKINRKRFDDSVAQLVERGSLKSKAVGSNPTRVANIGNIMMEKISESELKEKIASLEDELNLLLEQKNKKQYPLKHKFYSHSDKEGDPEEGRLVGFDYNSEAYDNFRRAGYEIVFDVLVFEDGTVKATHVNGIALMEPVEI